MPHLFPRAWTAALAAALVCFAGAAGSAQAAPQAASAATVRVTLSDFKIALSARSAKKGVVTFVVTNRGKLPHDFKIAGRKTAMLAPGKAARLRVKFAKPGRFPYSCTASGHSAAGMKGAFSVRA